MQIFELHGRGFVSWKMQVYYSLGRGTLESLWMFSHFELSSLKQGWMGYELVSLTRAAACLENSPIGTWSCSFIYLSSMAAIELQRQNRIICRTAKKKKSSKLKIFTSSPLQKKSIEKNLSINSHHSPVFPNKSAMQHYNGFCPLYD